MQKMEREALLQLKRLLVCQGYDPAGQLAGYLQTGDPTYLPPGEARRLAHGLEADVLLRAMTADFIGQEALPV